MSRPPLLLLSLVTAAALSASAFGGGGPPGTDPDDAGDAGQSSASLPTGQIITRQQSPDPPRLMLRAGDGRVPTGRPARPSTLPGENLHSPPAHQVGEAFATTLILDAATVMGDVALPWAFRIADEVDSGGAQQAVLDGIADWDDLPGSRWASTHLGGSGRSSGVADGVSLVFREASCEGTTNANTYVFTDGGIGLHRHGANGTMVVEADIGLCPTLTDPAAIRQTVRHEVGHVLGLAHLCDPGDACHLEAMGADNACSTMFWQSRSCQDSVDEGTLRGLRALYGTIRPLAGPTPAQTAARTSFAGVRDGRAETVVVSTSGVGADVMAAASAAAARRGGPLLLGVPDDDQCVDGPTRGEANRALQRRGLLVLVGDWPDACRGLAADWDLRLQVVAAGDPVAAAIDLWDAAPSDRASGQTSGGVVVLADVVAADDAADPVGAVAAGLAAAEGAPLLPITDPSGRLTRWLARRAPDTVIILGGPRVADAAADASATARAMGAVVQVVDGPDVVELALDAASQAWRSTGGQGPVVLVPDTPAVTSAAAAPLAASRDGVVLVVPGVADARVVAWLQQRQVDGGWAVGATDVMPPALLAELSPFVG